MRFIINGEDQAVDFQDDLPTLELLITTLGFDPKQIVVEFNGVILSQQKWAKQKVKDQDKLEIVTIVGGG